MRPLQVCSILLVNGEQTPGLSIKLGKLLKIFNSLHSLCSILLVNGEQTPGLSIKLGKLLKIFNSLHSFRNLAQLSDSSNTNTSLDMATRDDPL